MSSSLDIAIGSRVLVLQDKGTVRYVGHVANQKGTWVGIEWDDPSRGKHDGSTGGSRYFTCSHPTGGSFIRCEKVGFGVTLLHALKSRYHNEMGDYGSSVGEEAMYVETSSRRVLRVELVGLDKVQKRQSKLDIMTSARLVGLNVAAVGDVGALQNAAPELQELDLTDNLISTWGTVEEIFSGLPSLAFIDLSQNRVDLGSSATAVSFSPLTALQGLVLNRTGVSWQQVLRLQDSLVNLKELHLCSNGIHTLAPEAPLPEDHLITSAFRSLKVLNLEGNNISEWSQVALLSALPSLSHLHLSHNPIPSITYPYITPLGAPSLNQSPATPSPPNQSQSPAAPGHVPFLQLEALYLGHCQLSQWSCIDQLDKFPHLQELRVSDNPLLHALRGGGRFEVIGRIGGLTMLNGAVVNPRERRDADIRYLQNILAEFPAVAKSAVAVQLPAAAATGTGSDGGGGGGAAAATSSDGSGHAVDPVVLHPRLPLLQENYGAVCSTASAPSKEGTSMAATSVSLQLRLAATGRTLKKKIPCSITVANLKMLLEKLFKIQVASQQLLLLDPTGGGGLDIGADDSQQLAFFSVQDGQVVEVHEVDPHELSQQQQAAKRKGVVEHQLRLEEQLRVGEQLQEAAQTTR